MLNERVVGVPVPAPSIGLAEIEATMKIATRARQSAFKIKNFVILTRVLYLVLIRRGSQEGGRQISWD